MDRYIESTAQPEPTRMKVPFNNEQDKTDLEGEIVKFRHYWVLANANIFRPLMVALLIASLVVVNACADREPIAARAWKVPDYRGCFPEKGPSSAECPPGLAEAMRERTPPPEKAIPKEFGSAIPTLGELHALHDLGWLDHAQYLAAVSGGSWTVVPYTFLPSDMSDERFFGRFIPPMLLTNAVIEGESEHQGAMAEAISRAHVWARFARALVRGERHEAYADILGDIFLAPFDLNEEKFFTWREPALSSTTDLGRRYGNPGLSARDFYVPGHERPYLIVGSTLLLKGPQREALLGREPFLDAQYVYPFEITPLYVGTRTDASAACPNDSTRAARPGGFYVEPLGLDAVNPNFVDSLTYTAELRSRQHRFELSDMIAASGVAPQRHLVEFGLGKIGFPRFYSWVLLAGPYGCEFDQSFAFNPSAESVPQYAYGDGGHVDNIGLISPLAREVDNILVFVNASEPLSAAHGNLDVESPNLKSFWRQVARRSSRVPPADMCDRLELGDLVANTVNTFYDDIVSYFVETRGKPANRVLDGGCGSLVSLIKGLQDDFLHCEQYGVAKAPRHGVHNAYKVKVCWVYLGADREWMDHVRNNKDITNRTRELISSGDNVPWGFPGFPHYPTLFANKRGLYWSMIDVTQRQVNALENLAYWIVCAREERIAEGLDLPEGRSASSCHETEMERVAISSINPDSPDEVNVR